MDLKMTFADKVEMFRSVIDKQADEEIAQSTKEIRAKKNAVGKARAEHALAEELAQLRAEKNAAEMQFKKELSRCEFETTKAVRAHRKELIDGFFEELRGDLMGFAESDKYEEHLKRSLKKAEKELGEEFVVLAAAKDVERLKRLTKREVRADRTIMLGGISGFCEEKGLYADYTLDSALEREREAFTDKTELRL